MSNAEFNEGQFPQEEECDFCDGRGFILRDADDIIGQPCEACEGSGKAPTHSPTSAAEGREDG